MPPQNSYNPMPQPIQTPFPTDPPPSPTGQPPPKRLQKTIVIALVILIVMGAAGYTVYFLSSKNTNDHAANIDTKHVGSYPYVNACNAFTADDFDASAGVKSDPSLVDVQFAEETDASNPTRSYISTCSRHELQGQKQSTDTLVIELAIRQYADTQRTKDQMLIFGLYGATSDPELGGLAHFSSPKFTFQKDNKVISVLIQGYGDMNDSQIQKLAKSVAKKVSDRLATSANFATLAYPAELAGEGYVYQNACSLWGLADFERQFGHINKTSIKMTYAEGLVAQAQLPSDAKQSAHSSCVLGTKETGGSFAYIDAYYYPNTAQAQAGYDSYAHPDEDIALTGLGDKAVLQAYDASAKQYEKIMVLRGTTMFKVQFVPEENTKRGNSQVQVDVKTMAETVLSRLK